MIEVRQLIPALPGIVLKRESGYKTVVAFALTSNWHILPCVFGVDGEVYPIEGDTNHALEWDL